MSQRAPSLTSSTSTPYLELDDIIYRIQKFGGASTYWSELSKWLPEFINAGILHTSSSKLMRLHSPPSRGRIFHSSHFRISSSPLVKNVVTIHDLIYEKNILRGPSRILNLYQRREAIRRADAIICISYSTKRDMYEFYGNLLDSIPVYVIHHGCSPLPAVDDEDTRLLAQLHSLDQLSLTTGRFYLFVGGRSGYKNFELALRAFSAGRFGENDFKLICTGAPFNRHETELIHSLRLSDSVISLGIVDSCMLGTLYHYARALVYPSAYEGFGLPVLEAMHAGCPVICTNSSSLPEVVGSCGVLIAPDSIEELSLAMTSVLSSESRLQLIQAGIIRARQFCWRASAQAHSEVYNALVPV